MRHSIGLATAALSLALVALTLSLPPTTAAADEAASPSPEPALSPSPQPTPRPARAEAVRWARHWRRLAVREWRTWNRARECLGLERRPFASPEPPRSASQAEWLAAGRSWKHRVRPGGPWTYQERTHELVRRMKRPGGSGAARWLPLARWAGWPQAEWQRLIVCIRGESGGRPQARGSAGEIGLMQIHPVHRVRNAQDPLVNLKAGLRLWRARGWRPWTVMRAWW